MIDEYDAIYSEYIRIYGLDIVSLVTVYSKQYKENQRNLPLLFVCGCDVFERRRSQQAPPCIDNRIKRGGS